MSLQQLVKELEAQLAQLKGFSRDQALQLSDAQEEEEQWSARAGALEQVRGNQGWDLGTGGRESGLGPW